MDSPGTKAELLERIRAERARLEAAVAGLTSAQMTAPMLHDGWSVKDALAHVAWWEGHTNRRIERGRGQELPQTPAAALEDGLPSDDTWLNRLNARVFEHNRPRQLSDVIDEFHRSFEQVVATIEALDERDLFERSALSVAIGRPVLELIAGDTFEHYREHAEEIEQARGR